MLAVRRLVQMGAVLLVPLAAGPLSAQQMTFFANITNSQEVPPTHPTTVAGAPRISFGTATFVLNAAHTQLSFNATVFGLDFTHSQSADPNDDLLNAHIHSGPNGPGSGLNNPVAWGFHGSPFNDLFLDNANTVPSGLTDDCTAFATGVGGTCSGVWNLLEGNNTTLQAQLPNILAGNAYINFHTVQFAGGEIRGYLTAVPEPSAYALVGTGLVGLAALRMRRRRA
ncbi:PEP motif putative anchor domain protein [Gemmatirosa kalamazoonensis]|uniref:PEP motif putative anchor domain protein n=1 Tax=Gemmatirosa kalamazoonensis TaxID=861299 RepID=W0RGF8_9BACT|nr:CHRD domain-containing protein [Gemmatirosa kalamazoonensis]AHG89861.1 PEP motif putative anchor domain protein [Gemmatirosa kalamazoonensis]